MYNLPYHKEKDEKVILEFIEQHPLAFLSGSDEKKRPVATQIPVFVEEHNGKKMLRGHIMRNTDHHKAFLHNENVLAVFTSKNAYVSGSWYTNPYMASTWNYMSVHAKGTIRFVDEEELIDILRKTSLHFENQNEASPTVFDNLPEDFRKRVINAIAGFEIEIQELDTVFKLSQDRDYQSYLNIIEKLRGGGTDGHFIADEMEKRTKDLFPEESAQNGQ